MLSVASKLKDKKLKVTPQRIAIYNMLINTTKHPSVETIHNELKEDHPYMSLATIYKTLDTFKKSGLVQALNVGEDCFRYDASTHCHPHFMCRHCHEIYDLPDIDSMDMVVDELTHKTGFTIESEQMYFYGVCKACLAD